MIILARGICSREPTNTGSDTTIYVIELVPRRFLKSWRNSQACDSFQSSSKLRSRDHTISPPTWSQEDKGGLVEQVEVVAEKGSPKTCPGRSMLVPSTEMTTWFFEPAKKRYGWPRGLFFRAENQVAQRYPNSYTSHGSNRTIPRALILMFLSAKFFTKMK